MCIRDSNYTDEVKPILDKLGGIWEEKENTEYIVNDPQKIVEYCSKKRYSIEEFEKEYTERGLSGVSRIILKNLSKYGNIRATDLIELSQNNKKQ